MPHPAALPTLPLRWAREVPLDAHDTSYFADSASTLTFSSTASFIGNGIRAARRSGKQFLHLGRNEFAICHASQFLGRNAHHLAHVAWGSCPDLNDDSFQSIRQLFVSQLLGQKFFEDGNLPAFLLIQILTPLFLVNLGRLFALLCELLDELEMRELSDKVIDKMASVVLPIYYPADPGSSKLRFVIQCSAAAFLVKHSPKLRASVLDSLIEIYDRFPHVIGSSKPLKIVVEALTACDDFWVVFQSQTEGRSVDFRWCLLLYCFDSGVSTVDGWKAVESLMQNKETFEAGRFEKILEFLTRAVDAWGPNAMISQLLIDMSLLHSSFNFTNNR